MKRPRPCGSLRLLVVLLLILSAGCARLLPPPRQPIGEEARRALSRLVERWHAFADLRALAEVRVARGDDRRLLQGVLLARAPASLRFEALSPLGSPLLIVVIHEERLTAYNAATNEALIGEATAAAAARNLSFPVDPDDLVGILVGRPVPPKDVRVAEIMPPDEHGPSLGLSGADWHQRLWMDFTTGVVHRVELTGGRYEVLVTYQRDGDGQLTGLDFTAAQSLLTGSVRYQQAVFGGGIEPDRFRLVIPAGAKVEELVN